MHTTLEILNHPLLDPVRHGFFTRRGGASSGLFAGLNCGFGSSDQGEIVAINRARVAEAMGVAPAALLTVHQTHSAEVAVVSDAAQLPEIGKMRADAIVTDQPGIAIAVLTADCQPILLADPQAGVIGAVHAGRKGALAGVIEATLGAMADLGARAPYAVVGPSVCGRCYEVPEEMRAAAAAVEPASATVSWTGTPAIDVGAGVVAQLAGRGVPVTWVPGCTREDDRLFSYRRTSPTGRFAGAIRRYAVDPAYLIERPSHPTETS